MKRKEIFSVIVVFAVTLAFMLPTSAMFANDTTNDITNDVTVQVTKVRFEPPSQTVETGETFTASYYIEPTDWIIGANFVTISFDPTFLQANSVTKGTFFNGNELLWNGGTIDNVAGTISDGYALVLPVDAVNTPGSVFVITFTAKDTFGISDLIMSGVTVKNNTGKSVPITVESGSVTVGTEGYFDLTIGVVGNGTTDPLPGTYSYISGTVVDLEAIPDLGWSFDHWDGDVADPNSAITTITMDDNKTIIATFEEESGNPPTSAVDPLPQWTKTIPFTVTATAFDNTGVANVTLWSRYSSDGTEWTDWISYGTDEEVPWSWLFTGSDGYYEFYSIAIDDIGNVEDPPYVADASTGIDTVPPFTEINLSGPMGDNGWYIGVVEVTFNATDEGNGVTSTWYRWKTPHYNWYTGPFMVSGDKKHTVEYFSTDGAGNVEPVNEAEVKIDTTPPVTTHEFDGLMGDSGWFVDDVTVTLSAKDATSGVNYTRYKINDSGDWEKYNESFVITENGIYTIYYYSVDFAGHREETNDATFKIDKDEEPPVTEHEFSGIIGDNDWYVRDVTVTLSAEDNAAGVESTHYNLDGGDWKNYTNPFYVTGDGEHTIEYYSVDKVGNIEENKSATFKIDKTTPTIDLDAEGAGSTWLLKATVSDETSGIDRVEFYVSGEYLGNVTTSPYEYEVTNPKRGDKGQAIVYDKAGNEAISPPVDAVPQSQDQDAFIGYTFLVGLISNVEEAENIITAQAIRLRYIEVAPTGIAIGFVLGTVVEFSSHNLVGRITSRPFGRMSLVFGVFKGGITIEDE